MHISQLKEAILLCREAGITPWVWGHRGLGKSSLVKQIAQSYGIGFRDFRCSQIEHSDLRGLPDRSEGVTKYFPPDELPREIDKDEALRRLGAQHKNPPDEEIAEQARKMVRENNNGIILLDELNRAEDDVIQASFQLVLDRRIGNYELPDGWSVVVAGNYPEGYTTNNFDDPAFLDRFCHLELTIGDEYIAEWASYMRNYGSSARIMQFIGSNTNHLCGDVKGNLNFTIQPSPRSWEMLAKVEEHSGDHSPEVVHQVRVGLIGAALAQHYKQFSCKVDPKDVINNGTGQLQKHNLDRTETQGLMFGILSHLSNSKISPKQRNNVLDFMRHLAKNKERDLAAVFGIQLIRDEVKDQSAVGAVLSNPNVAKLLASGKKSGWVPAIVADKELTALVSKAAWGQ